MISSDTACWVYKKYNLLFSFCRFRMYLEYAPKTFDEMDTESRTNYIADEIMNYFQLSQRVRPEVPLAIVCLTILVNVSLLLAIVLTGNIKKFHSFLEVARGLTESLMLCYNAL